MGKNQGGRTYCYLVESARVGGKPRIVSQRYHGSADEIAQRMSESGPGEPDLTRHLAFGDLAAMWSGNHRRPRRTRGPPPRPRPGRSPHDRRGRHHPAHQPQRAYAAAREWRATGGKTGLPCIEIGRTLRVPRADLERLLGRSAWETRIATSRADDRG